MTFLPGIKGLCCKACRRRVVAVYSHRHKV